MEKFEVLKLLKAYRRWVKRGAIDFLQEKEKSDDVVRKLDELIEDFDKATKKAEDEGKDEEANLSTHLDWYETHKRGRKLWQKLFEVTRQCAFAVQRARSGRGRCVCRFDATGAMVGPNNS